MESLEDDSEPLEDRVASAFSEDANSTDQNFGDGIFAPSFFFSHMCRVDEETGVASDTSLVYKVHFVTESERFKSSSLEHTYTHAVKRYAAIVRRAI